MNKKLFSVAIVLFVGLLFIGCDNGLTDAEVKRMVDGPNSVKGTITGKMNDGTAYSFKYDYHVTVNDQNSYSESWVDGETRYLYVYQYFFFDRNGYSEYGSRWSPSGQYMVLDFYVNMETMEVFPISNEGIYLEGVWQNITEGGNRFAYHVDYSSWNDNAGTMNMTDLKYNKKSQILSGKFNLIMGENHGNYSRWNNYKATTISGDYKIYVPRELFEIKDGSGNSGIVHRTRN